MNKHVFLTLLVSLPFFWTHAEKQAAYELPRTHVIPIQDTALKRQYELYVKLPEEYSENSDKKHPVIFYTDAVWHIETLSALADFLATDSILVGISWQIDIGEDRKKELGAHASRFRDYRMRESSDPDLQAKMQFGQASNHLKFIRDNVIPFVENNFHTDPENRTYFGYSLGGQFGAYVLLTHPGSFRNYILGAPAFGEAYGPYLAKLDSTTTRTPGNHLPNVFIAYGTQDNNLAKLGEPLVALLNEKNGESLSLTVEEPEGNHLTAFPATAVLSATWLSKLRINQN